MKEAVKVNSVIRWIAQQWRDMAEIKAGDIKLLFDIPGFVKATGNVSNFYPEDE